MSDEDHLDYDGASMPELLEHLSSADASERADAACAMGDRLRTREIPSFEPPVQERLAALLSDPTPIVRLEAAIALAEAHDRRATQLLLSAIASRAFRLDATRALGTLGDPAAIEPLAKLMSRWLMPWADRLQAAAALCALAERRGQAYLKEKLGSRRHAERAAAVHFLGESRHPEALALLARILADRAHPLRDTAARALGLLGDPAARAHLEQAKEGADEALREDIDEALARLVPTGAAP